MADAPKPSKKLLDPCLKLIGVEVVGDIKKSPKNGTYFSFKTPYSSKLFYSKNYRSSLKKLGKSVTTLLLDLNQLTLDDLPLCEVCNKSPVRLGPRTGEMKNIHLINPVLGQVCWSPKCGASLGQLRKIEKLGPDEYSKFQSEVNSKRVKSGKHPSQTHGHFRYEVDGVNEHFNSNTELRVFIKYKRLLKKYYLREKYVSSYGKDNRSYSADYILKPEYEHLNYPNVIEVKSNNLFYCGRYDKKQAGIDNYYKFKSVLELEKTVMVIDNRGSKLITNDQYLHYIKSIDDLNNLFREVNLDG